MTKTSFSLLVFTIIFLIGGVFWLNLPEKPPSSPALSPTISIFSGATLLGYGFGFASSLAITASHVVANHQHLQITTSQNNSTRITKIIADPLLDLSILQLDSRLDFPSPDFSSSATDPSQSLTIGSLTGSVVSYPETLSVFGRNLFHLARTDIPIDLGDSGSPVFDSSGSCLGIVLARSDTDHSALLLPSHLISPAINSFLTSGRIIRPYFGAHSRVISLASYNLDQAYGALIVGEKEQGRFAITPDSPAMRAGLQRGDIVLSVNNSPVTISDPLDYLLLSYLPGDQIALTIWRDNQKTNITLSLDSTK